MIFWISGIAFSITILFVLSVIYFPRALPIAVPAMFLALFLAITHIPDYMGFALDSSYLNGQEAIVLDTIQGDSWIYLLLQVEDEKEPRLLKMPNTDANKKLAADLKEKAKKALTIIKIGSTSEARAVSGGGDAYGSGTSVQQIDPGQSKMFAKP